MTKKEERVVAILKSAEKRFKDKGMEMERYGDINNAKYYMGMAIAYNQAIQLIEDDKHLEEIEGVLKK